MHPALFKKILKELQMPSMTPKKDVSLSQLKLQLQMMTHMLCMRATLQYAVDNFWAVCRYELQNALWVPSLLRLWWHNSYSIFFFQMLPNMFQLHELFFLHFFKDTSEHGFLDMLTCFHIHFPNIFGKFSHHSTETEAFARLQLKDVMLFQVRPPQGPTKIGGPRNFPPKKLIPKKRGISRIP